jgi:hypothetical protein
MVIDSLEHRAKATHSERGIANRPTQVGRPRLLRGAGSIGAEITVSMH